MVKTGKMVILTFKGKNSNKKWSYNINQMETFEELFKLDKDCWIHFPVSHKVFEIYSEYYM